MFYDIFLKLCNDRGISPSAAALDMGFTKAANTKWAAGKTPRDATLAKIAEYFSVSVDYLKGETDNRRETKEKAPTPVKSVEAMYIAELANSLPDQKRKEAVAYLLALQKEADSEKQ